MITFITIFNVVPEVFREGSYTHTESSKTQQQPWLPPASTASCRRVRARRGLPSWSRQDLQTADKAGGTDGTAAIMAVSAPRPRQQSTKKVQSHLREAVAVVCWPTLCSIFSRVL
ncbi:unnamed protein product [Nesidiocoris tenuis]|uniref:Uncharacterized protein n=1 Tax=Nesidiocoris tenuis TaxID=355587 RepID=A0A6H5G3H6_9HEMI|nr:unnamed protein product [Nesidiocoris tenuis]